MERVGTVRGVFRYPVKSMAGESQQAAKLGWHGLEGDRRFAFRLVADGSGFPWLSASKLPALIRHRAYYPGGEPGRAIRVVTPEGEELPGDSAELRQRMERACGEAVELMHLKQGIFDDAPVSIISVATIQELTSAGGVAFDARRFRPNIVVDLPDARAFAEDAWVGRRIHFGSPAGAVVAVTLRDLRCAMVNLDPESAVSDPRVLKATAKLNAVCAGVYGVVAGIGTLAVGDPLYLA